MVHTHTHTLTVHTRRAGQCVKVCSCMRLLFTFLLLSLEAQSLSLSLSCQTRADKVTKHFAKHYPHTLYPPETSPHFLSLSLSVTHPHARITIHTHMSYTLFTLLCQPLSIFGSLYTRWHKGGGRREREKGPRVLAFLNMSQSNRRLLPFGAVSPFRRKKCFCFFIQIFESRFCQICNFFKKTNSQSQISCIKLTIVPTLLFASRQCSVYYKR